MFFFLLCKIEDQQCSISSMSQAVAAGGKIQDGEVLPHLDMHHIFVASKLRKLHAFT